MQVLFVLCLSSFMWTRVLSGKKSAVSGFQRSLSQVLTPHGLLSCPQDGPFDPREHVTSDGSA